MRGKAVGTLGIFIPGKDHPRLCGEKVGGFNRICTHTGSPPPMRGKGVSGFSLTSVPRITPAYAGKSLFGGI